VPSRVFGFEIAREEKQGRGLRRGEGRGGIAESVRVVAKKL
jgi:hypothetical protein